MLRALLEPTAELRQAGSGGRLHCASWRYWKSENRCRGRRIWEMSCQRHNTPAGSEWLENIADL
ncbi:L-rhamnose isomerase [Shigella flexneri]